MRIARHHALDELEAGLEIAILRVLLADDDHPSAKRPNQAARRGRHVWIRDAGESVAALGAQKRERYTEVPRGRLDYPGARAQHTAGFHVIDDLSRRLQLDGSGDVESFHLQVDGDVRNEILQTKKHRLRSDISN